jgi:hypothetical protein
MCDHVFYCKGCEQIQSTDELMECYTCDAQCCESCAKYNYLLLRRTCDGSTCITEVSRDLGLESWRFHMRREGQGDKIKEDEVKVKDEVKEVKVETEDEAEAEEEEEEEEEEEVEEEDEDEDEDEEADQDVSLFTFCRGIPRLTCRQAGQER